MGMGVSDSRNSSRVHSVVGPQRIFEGRFRVAPPISEPTGDDPPMTARLGNVTQRWAKDARTDQPTTQHQGKGSGLSPAGGPPSGAGQMASAAQSMVVRTGGFQW